MEKIEIESYAKINLSLDVLYKRSDKYHEINTVMQQIDLHDLVKIENISGKDIIIESNKKDLPLDSSNLVYRAWESIKEKTGIERAIRVKIDKRIPVAAGLAGGSSNAAATLLGLNKLWDLKLSRKELQAMGLKIGADLPYCLVGGTVHARGIGEVLTRLKPFKDKHLLLFNPGIEISTADVYGNLEIDKDNRIDIGKIIDFIEKDDLKSLSENMENMMEKVVIEQYPIIGEAKRDMVIFGALGSLMSGSGATVFGFFDDPDKLGYCKEKFQKKYRGTLIESKTI